MRSGRSSSTSASWLALPSLRPTAGEVSSDRLAVIAHCQETGACGGTPGSPFGLSEPVGADLGSVTAIR